MTVAVISITSSAQPAGCTSANHCDAASIARHPGEARSCRCELRSRLMRERRYRVIHPRGSVLARMAGRGEAVRLSSSRQPVARSAEGGRTDVDRTNAHRAPTPARLLAPRPRGRFRHSRLRLVRGEHLRAPASELRLRVRPRTPRHALGGTRFAHTGVGDRGDAAESRARCPRGRSVRSGHARYGPAVGKDPDRVGAAGSRHVRCNLRADAPSRRDAHVSPLGAPWAP